ncbi:MAG: ABC transporter substrate-binding protein [Acidimicrobiales bacterium]
MIVVDLLFDSPAVIDPETNRAEAALAESWSVGADGVTWTFVLREGAMFSNGEPVKGDDVKYSLERMARSRRRRSRRPAST